MLVDVAGGIFAGARPLLIERVARHCRLLARPPCQLLRGRAGIGHRPTSLLAEVAHGGSGPFQGIVGEFLSLLASPVEHGVLCAGHWICSCSCRSSLL